MIDRMTNLPPGVSVLDEHINPSAAVRNSGIRADAVEAVMTEATKSVRIRKRKSKDGRYFYTIQAIGNNEHLVTSQMHPHRRDMEHAVTLFLECGLNALVVDEART